MNLFIEVMRKTIIKYDKKHGVENSKPIFICNSIDSRNRYKNDKYKIPADKPQCPVFNDNRCCGGCNLAGTCNNSVDCGCYGYTYARLGGNDAGYYMHKASMYYKNGRLTSDGKFDWDYLKLMKFKDRSLNFRLQCEIGKYVITVIDNKYQVANIISVMNSAFKIFVHLADTNTDIFLTVDDIFRSCVFNTFNEATEIVTCENEGCKDADC